MSISNDLSPADIRACTEGGSGYNNGMGWGGDWATWIIVFLIFGMFGWGGNGWGGGFGGGNGAGVVDGYVLASDFSNIERKIDGVNNGICDGFYAMNTAVLLREPGSYPGGQLQSGHAELRNPEHRPEHHQGHHRRYELRLPLH